MHGALMHRQLTPETQAAAEARQGPKVQAALDALARARKESAASDNGVCNTALGDGLRALNR